SAALSPCEGRADRTRSRLSSQCCTHPYRTGQVAAIGLVWGVCAGTTTRIMSLLTRISTHTDERSARLYGIGLMLLSVFMFSFGDALGKYLVSTYAVGNCCGCAPARR